jgi:hypothetical protein
VFQLRQRHDRFDSRFEIIATRFICGIDLVDHVGSNALPDGTQRFGIIKISNRCFIKRISMRQYKLNKVVSSSFAPSVVRNLRFQSAQTTTR